MTPQQLQQLQQLLQRAETRTKSGDHAEARLRFLKILDYVPDNPDLLFAAGNAARHCGLFEEAVKQFRLATEIRTGFFAALCNLGASLKAVQRYEEAIKPLQQAAALQPDHLALSMQLADLYLKTGKPDKAREVLERAAQVAPDNPEILCGLGNCALTRKNLSEAKAFYHRALQLKPDHGDAHYNLGTIMREWKHLDEAVSCFRNAVRFKPGTTAPLVDLGETLQLLGETDESETVFRQALSVDPHCDLAVHNLLVSMQYNPRHTRRDLEAAHSTWGERFRQENRTTVTRRQRTPERKLTIGYLSPDLRNHPAASFLEPVLRHHDRNRFTIHCYSQTIENDWRTDRFKTLADKWCTVEHLDDATLTDLIQSHGIDILIDSAGHLCGNRLGVFSRRAAPLQIGGIGYPGLRGLETIDYRISDPLIDPPTEETGSTEIPLRIAPCFCCWQPPENLPPVTPLPALHNGFITFGSLHTTARLNEPVINLWCELLRTIPDAQLLLCRTTLSASVIKRLSGYFSRNGISLSRIIFKTNIPPEGHLTVYNEIDIALDTLPWSGHTTSCESLIMGVPVLSLYGDRPAGRMVASVLTAAGLESWVARSPEEYIIRGSWNHRELSVLRLQLRDQVLNSRLCNTETYTATLEDALMKLC